MASSRPDTAVGSEAHNENTLKSAPITPVDEKKRRSWFSRRKQAEDAGVNEKQAGSDGFVTAPVENVPKEISFTQLFR